MDSQESISAQAIRNGKDLLSSAAWNRGRRHDTEVREWESKLVPDNARQDIITMPYIDTHDPMYIILLNDWSRSLSHLSRLENDTSYSFSHWPHGMAMLNDVIMRCRSIIRRHSNRDPGFRQANVDYPPRVRDFKGRTVPESPVEVARLVVTQLLFHGVGNWLEERVTEDPDSFKNRRSSYNVDLNTYDIEFVQVISGDHVAHNRAYLPLHMMFPDGIRDRYLVNVTWQRQREEQAHSRSLEAFEEDGDMISELDLDETSVESRESDLSSSETKVGSPPDHGDHYVWQ
ncbi:hypothetical protein CIB48_g11172 [Xylaria polymorpha]|nr:hypothetical protein CIB48_g11172 [Xylaria polymorpha]